MKRSLGKVRMDGDQGGVPWSPTPRMNDLWGLSLMRFILIYLLVVSFSGLTDLIPLTQAAITDSTPPILRHTPPAPLTLGETLLIRAVVEDESDIMRVSLWYRVSGSQTYQKILMTKVSGNTYEARVPVTEDFEEGIEYYIEAVDRFGNEGMDGTEAVPYFVEIRTGDQRMKRPWWKSSWFWMGVALAIGGGVAVATRSGGKSQGSGTVIVE